MNKTRLTVRGGVAGLALLLGAPTWAGSVTGSISPANGLIADNDSNGLSSSIFLNPAFTDITSVTVSLNIEGDPFAYDGDYYAYLEFGSTLVTLMNTPGSGVYGAFGSPGNGMSVTFSDTAVTSIVNASAPGQDPLTGTYLPQTPLSAFNGAIPLSGQNGLWTLFIADDSPGGVGELASWTLTVSGDTPTGVPDGGSPLAMLCGAGGLVLLARRCFRPRNPIQAA